MFAASGLQTPLRGYVAALLVQIRAEFVEQGSNPKLRSPQKPQNPLPEVFWFWR